MKPKYFLIIILFILTSTGSSIGENKVDMSKFFDTMILESLEKVKKEKINIYTFTFYHDHESDAVSICIDTEVNSDKVVKSSNEFTRKYFQNELKNGNLELLKLWNCNTGRNFSLGDFAYVNLVYKEIYATNITPYMYIEMMKSIERNKSKILSNSVNPGKVMFCCSSSDNEVEYIWY